MHSASTVDFTGVVLAGGRSSRMGTNKAFLEYCGKPLVRHMMDLLEAAGAKEVRVSGSLAGYPCIPDEETFAGPACAMAGILRSSRIEARRSVLFVPVDMPALTVPVLKKLTAHQEGAYFAGWPLPAFLPVAEVRTRNKSVQGLLDATGAQPLPIDEADRACFVNLNTPEEWMEVVA